MVDRWHQMNEKRLLMGNNAISGRRDSKDSRNRTRWVDIVAVIGNQYFSQVVEKHIRGAFGEMFSCLHILHLPFESQNFSIVCLPRKSPWIMLLSEFPQAKSVKTSKTRFYKLPAARFRQKNVLILKNIKKLRKIFNMCYTPV